jgi:hypothetical protein
VGALETVEDQVKPELVLVAVVAAGLDVRRPRAGATELAEIFAGVQDFHADLLRSAQEGDTEWAGWHWHGTRADGTRLAMTSTPNSGTQEELRLRPSLRPVPVV